ncbi:hypothetical protein BG006_003938, partial [Podila minutissima]
MQVQYSPSELKNLLQLREVQLIQGRFGLTELVEFLHDPPANLFTVDLGFVDYFNDCKTLAQAILPSSGSRDL